MNKRGDIPITIFKQGEGQVHVECSYSASPGSYDDWVTLNDGLNNYTITNIPEVSSLTSIKVTLMESGATHTVNTITLQTTSCP